MPFDFGDVILVSFPWPDIIVAAVMAALATCGGRQIIGQSFDELCSLAHAPTVAREPVE